jgi:hypothetical protein
MNIAIFLENIDKIMSREKNNISKLNGYHYELLVPNCLKTNILQIITRKTRK